MKKILSLVLIGVMCLMLIGCGNSDVKVTKEQNGNNTNSTENADNENDNDINESNNIYKRIGKDEIGFIDVPADFFEDLIYTTKVYYLKSDSLLISIEPMDKARWEGTKNTLEKTLGLTKVSFTTPNINGDKYNFVSSNSETMETYYFFERNNKYYECIIATIKGREEVLNLINTFDFDK